MSWVKLRKLALRYNWLSSVSPSLLASALCRLEDVDFRSTVMSVDQLIALFQEIVQSSDLRLRNVDSDKYRGKFPVTPDVLTEVRSRVSLNS